MRLMLTLTVLARRDCIGNRTPVLGVSPSRTNFRGWSFKAVSSVLDDSLHLPLPRTRPTLLKPRPTDRRDRRAPRTLVYGDPTYIAFCQWLRLINIFHNTSIAEYR